MNDDLTTAELENLLNLSLGNAYIHTRSGGAWYVCAPQGGELFHTFGKTLLDLGVWRHSLIWVKDQFVMGRADYHYRHEPIFYGWKEGAAHTWNSDRKQDSVLEFARPKRSREHPTMKPLDLIEYCVTNNTNRGDTVLDPFGGSGSTLMASHSSGRQARLIELDPKYCDVICARFQAATGIQPIHETTGEPHDFLEPR
jgi:site-specific DNA-methyltransferase (adenine-specific)